MDQPETVDDVLWQETVVAKDTATPKKKTLNIFYSI